MVEQLNTIGRLWWEWSAAMFWQVGLLILVIAILDRLTRRWAWPQLRYALWSLILIKLLLPPSLSLPSGVVPSVAAIVKQGLPRLQTEKPPVAEGRALFSLTEDMFSVHSVPVRASEEVSSLKGQVSSEQGQEPPLETPNFKLQTSSLVWQVYAMTASLAGTLILGIWLYLRLHSLVGRRAQETAAASLPQSFYNQLAACARRLELGYIPRVVVTKRLATPAVFGMFRPVLLMPKGYLGKLSRRDTEHMLLHELAHIKRGDLIAHGLYMLLQVAYWYNPLLWLVRRQVHHLRELSCDATVAELLREQTTAYRQTLLETARRLLTSSVEPGLGLLGLFEDSNRLLVRLNWLTKPTWRYRTMKRVTVAVVAALMLTCVLPMARAQEAVSHQPSPEVVKHDDQASQEIAALKAQLDALIAQQKQLQEQLRAMTAKRGQPVDPTASKSVTLSLVKEEAIQGDVTVVPWQDEDPTAKKERDLRHVRENVERARQDQLRATTEQKRAQFEAQRARPGTDPTTAMPAMPAMPATSAMPQVPPMSANVHVPIPQAAPSPGAVPHVEEVPAVPVQPEAPQAEAKAEQVVRCGDLLVKSLPSGTMLQVENNVGNVTIEGVSQQERDCTVKATARIKSENRDEAERIAKEILVQVTPVDGRVRIAVQMPEGMSQEQRNKISVDLRIVAPSDVKTQARLNVGNLSLANLQGKVEAAVEVGAIRTWNLLGDVAIRTNVGNIEFAASEGLSAKIQAQAQVGSVSSNLPLVITGAAMKQAGNAQVALGSHASGTVGQGDKKIDLTTNVGSIQIRRREGPQTREVF